MLPRILIAAAVLYFLALIGAIIAPRLAKPVTSPAVAGHVYSPIKLPDPLIGFAINFHHTQDLSLYLKAVDEIAALGFNSLEIVTPAFQDDGASQTIRIEHGPGLSPTREDLVELLLYARSKGLSTTLMPIVLFTKPRGNEWRGKITPEQWGPWWDSYQHMIDYFVEIALESDVQLFSVGSELLTTETNFEQWQKVIKQVRARYNGKLIYSTNWDHYHIPTFWNQVDYIGVSGYWDLTTLSPADNLSDPDSLSKRWIEIRSRLLTYSNAQKRPVIITEIGYPSLPWALKSPWNYVAAGPKATSDPQAQAVGYRAFLAAWEDVLAPPSRRLAPRLEANDRVNDRVNESMVSVAVDAQPTDTQAATTTQPAQDYPVSQPVVREDGAGRSSQEALSTARPLVQSGGSGESAPAPSVRIRREGLLGFYFYAWDVYREGGPSDTGYGVRNKPSLEVLKQFMKYHQFKPVTPPDEQ